MLSNKFATLRSTFTIFAATVAPEAFGGGYFVGYYRRQLLFSFYT